MLNSFWGRKVDEHELHSPARLERLFRWAALRGAVIDGPRGRADFFALARYVGRQRVRNRVGLFTSFLDGNSYLLSANGRGWWTRPSAADRDWAQRAVRGL